MDQHESCKQADDRAKVFESSEAPGSPKGLTKSESDRTTKEDATSQARSAGLVIAADGSLPSLENNLEAPVKPNDKLHKEKGHNIESTGLSTAFENAGHAPQLLPGSRAGVPPQQDPDSRPKLRFNPSSKKSMLIKAVIEYTQTIENSLDGLNSTLGRDRHGKDIRDEGPPRPMAPEPKRAVHTGDLHAIDVKMETKFYPCDGLFDFEGDFRPACDKEMTSALQDSGSRPSAGGPAGSHRVRDSENLPHPSHSNYTCRSEPPYLIRVLYDSTLGTPGQDLVIDESPKADKVDIIGFMVTSQPIADFFNKRLGLDAGAHRVLKFGRPFRSVIRNIQHLRGHLSSLAASNDQSKDEISTTAEQPVDVIYKDESSQQSDDHTSSPSVSEKQQDKESYDEVTAYGHFKYFLEFLDQYLAVKIQLFHDLKGAQREKIAFEDLWMLFDTGDTIYSPLRQGRTVVRNEVSSLSGSNSGSDFPDEDDRIHCTRRRYVPQAYRVLATVGGSSLRKTWAPKDIEMETEFLTDQTLLQLFLSRSARNTGLQADFQPKQRIKERYSPLHILCMYIDFDGIKYGTETDIFVFKPFDGELSVKSLEAYPLRYAISPRADYLLQRGRKFVDVTTSSTHMKHKGSTVGEIKEEIHGPVVIDTKLSFTEYRRSFPEDDMVIPAFKPFTNKFWPDISAELSDFSVIKKYSSCEHGPYCLGYTCVFDFYPTSQKDQLEKLEPRIQEILEEAEFVPHEQGDIEQYKAYLEDQDLIELLPGVVPGFALRNRSWVQLNLDQLDFVEKENEWKKLTLPKGHKQIVQAMVEMHSSGSENSVDDGLDKIEMDLVRGKGKGCIILLHGVPGVGKTSTAECVASYTKRPLYSITCGDVGYEPEDVERNMGRHFKLAHKWGCVLLLDEADVFLAKRNKTDVKRNGLVSSFLRILEYYSGILFLTTNRVGAIDDAFRSRLHLTLYYPKLTETQTMRIWKTNLQRLKEINKERLESSRQPIDFNAKKLTKWVSKYWGVMQWNGRQIRNAFQTAMALAEFEAKQLSNPGSRLIRPVLEIKQFKLLAKASSQFNDYLRLTHGDDEDQRAVLDQVRAVPTPSARAKNFHDDDEYDDDDDDDDDEDFGSLLDSESDTDPGISEDLSGSSKDDGSDDDLEGKSHKSKKPVKRGGKSRAKIVIEEKREKGKGKRR